MIHQIWRIVYPATRFSTKTCIEIIDFGQLIFGSPCARIIREAINFQYPAGIWNVRQATEAKKIRKNMKKNAGKIVDEKSVSWWRHGPPAGSGLGWIDKNHFKLINFFLESPSARIYSTFFFAIVKRCINKWVLNIKYLSKKVYFFDL